MFCAVVGHMRSVWLTVWDNFRFSAEFARLTVHVNRYRAEHWSAAFSRRSFRCSRLRRRQRRPFRRALRQPLHAANGDATRRAVERERQCDRERALRVQRPAVAVATDRVELLSDDTVPLCPFAYEKQSSEREVNGRRHVICEWRAESTSKDKRQP